ncbi:hypothetical protein HDV00_012794 [Rhizophlyctis rosea]|nr:hypothetical protein HDV00_012794 [Rhizophlyctis rosea]
MDGIGDGRYDQLCVECFQMILPPEQMELDEAIAACKTAHNSRASDAGSGDSHSRKLGDNINDRDAGKGKGKRGEAKKRKKASFQKSADKDTTPSTLLVKPAD